MGRYTVYLRDGSSFGVDDVKVEDGMLCYITRYDHKRVSRPVDELEQIVKDGQGHEGGMRFTGEHNTSFSATHGSIGNSDAPVDHEKAYIYFNNGKYREVECVKMYNGVVEYWDPVTEVWRAVSSSSGVIKKVSDRRL